MILTVLLIHLSGGIDRLQFEVDSCPIVWQPEVQQIVAHSSLYEPTDKMKITCEVKRE